jgi:hypothetical protein
MLPHLLAHAAHFGNFLLAQAVLAADQPPVGYADTAQTIAVSGPLARIHRTNLGRTPKKALIDAAKLQGQSVFG